LLSVINMRVFLAAAVCALLVASVFGTTCTADIAGAAKEIGGATFSIVKAAATCRSNATGCAEDLSDAVADIGQASEFITAAVTDCGGSNNTACAKVLSNLAAELGKAGEAITKAVPACHKLSMSCLLDVAGATIDLGSVASDIKKAITDCKASTIKTFPRLNLSKLRALATGNVEYKVQAGAPSFKICSGPNAVWKDFSVSKSGDDLIMSGDLTKELTGGEFHVKATFAGMNVADDKSPICDSFACPVATGPFKFSSVYDNPTVPFPGKLVAETKMTNQDGEELACFILEQQL